MPKILCSNARYICGLATRLFAADNACAYLLHVRAGVVGKLWYIQMLSVSGQTYIYIYNLYIALVTQAFVVMYPPETRCSSLTSRLLLAYLLLFASKGAVLTNIVACRHEY